MRLTIKRGDTKHGIQAILKDRAGNAVELTNCTVKFNMSGKIIGGLAIVTDPAAGAVLYPLEATAVDTTGVYQAEFEVTYPDGRVETFPSAGYVTINIIPDIR